jgi:tetratricopeptide (TPR) repeat protein
VCYFLDGNEIAYRRVCQAMLNQFDQTTEPATAYDVVDTLVLRPHSATDDVKLVAMAEVARSWYVGAVRLEGAALCRVGRFEDALRAHQKAKRFHRFRPADWAFLAMTHYHLGQPESAKQCLANAQKWIKEADQQKFFDLIGVMPSWDNWYEREVATKLLAEATKLIQSPVSTSVLPERADE